MTLKQEIEATIAAYQEACKPENLNYEYCIDNQLQHGICSYCTDKYNKYTNLYNHLSNENFWLICQTPNDLENKIRYNSDSTIESNLQILLINPTILDCHQTRLKYLQNLLNEINQ